MSSRNPTEEMNVSFSGYVAKRKIMTEAHMDGAIPDYAYRPDLAFRQRLNSIPGFDRFAKAVTNTYVPAYRQSLNMECLRVGPNQYPDIYEILVDCARRLGIGIPVCFVDPDPTSINAYTLAVEDDDPVVVITSALLERFSPGEIRAALGHECGHIHNNHGVYSIAVDLILGTLKSSVPVVGTIINLASQPIQWGLLSWNRAAEVTCDRAGVICSDAPQDMVTFLAKSISGGAFGRTEIDIDSVLKQYDTLRETPMRLLEAVSSDHPLAVRRIFAIQEFENSEVLYGWRPEWKPADGKLVGKQELDLRCEKYIGVVKSEKRR